MERVAMTKTGMPGQTSFHLRMSEFWSGDLGLTLLTISLVVLVFIITPLCEAGIPGRMFFELIVGAVMFFGVLAIEQSRAAKFSLIAFVLLTAACLGAGRFHPMPLLHQ